MDEKYISTEGIETDVSTLNQFHLVNAFQKNVGILAVTPDEQAKTNIKLLKDEILKRLDTRPKEA